MSHRGANVVTGTVQHWDGTKWVEFQALALASAVSANNSTLWKETTNNTLGYTSSTALRESLSRFIDNDGTASPSFAEEKRVVILEGATEAAVTYVLPIPINGISPDGNDGGGRNADKLVAEVTVSVTRVDGSSVSVSKHLLAWEWSTDAAGYVVADNQLLTASGGTNVVTPNVDGSAPDAPTIEFSQSGTADQPRYYVDMDLKLFKNN